MTLSDIKVTFTNDFSDMPGGPWQPLGTVTLEFPMTRREIRRVRRWLLHPDQAPRSPVPVKHP